MSGFENGTVLAVEPHEFYIHKQVLYEMDGRWMVMQEARSVIDDSYIGDVSDGVFFTKKKIKPEKNSPDSQVASIGYCRVDNRWYGWSHRARCGFTIGSKVDKGSILEESLGVEFVAKSMEEAMIMAIEFAEAVG